MVNQHHAQTEHTDACEAKLTGVFLTSADMYDALVASHTYHTISSITLQVLYVSRCRCHLGPVYQPLRAPRHNDTAVLL